MVGSLLVDQLDRYSVNGRLPRRPSNDKQLLHALVSLGNCSDKSILPPSMQDIGGNEFMLATRIRDIADSNLLLVNRTYDPIVFSPALDKQFRFDNFVKLGEVELWVRKNL